MGVCNVATFKNGSWLAPVNSFLRVQLLVFRLARGETERLASTQAEHAARGQALEDQLMNPVLERFVEIDQNVPAKDEIELVE